MIAEKSDISGSDQAEMKILIVDDSQSTRLWLQELLEKEGWDVEQASDGRAACEILESLDIRIVVTDWMMPGMDGLSLIEWIRERRPEEYVYTILMTGRDSEEDCIEGLSIGADDYLVKPVSPSILYVRLSVAQRILAYQEELLAQQARLRESRNLTMRAYSSVQEDLKDAAAVQQSALPISGLLPRSITAVWTYKPAMEVSGDCLDIFFFGENKLVFYILDVSGHGVTAALRSASISQLLRPISRLMDGLREFGPAHVIRHLNRHLCEGNKSLDYLATLVMGDLDASTGLLRLVSAGHPPPLLYRIGSGVRELHGGGLPLGIDAEAAYEQFETELQPNDSLFLYSDGLLDCEDLEGRRYGLDTLKNNIDGHAHLALPEFLFQLESDLESWRGGAPLTDDLSALFIRFNSDND